MIIENPYFVAYDEVNLIILDLKNLEFNYESGDIVISTNNLINFLKNINYRTHSDKTAVLKLIKADTYLAFTKIDNTARIYYDSIEYEAEKYAEFFLVKRNSEFNNETIASILFYRDMSIIKEIQLSNSNFFGIDHEISIGNLNKNISFVSKILKLIPKNYRNQSVVIEKDVTLYSGKSGLKILELR